MPFADRISDGEMVDASSVSRGRDCGCICQSCSAPLVARQGDIRVWHFAHATSDSNAEKVCEYSPLVSIRLMAHQILGELDEISLPPAPNESRTEARNAPIQSIMIDTRFEESAVDAIATIKRTSLVIYMTYKSRPIPTALHRPTQKDAGVLEIDLNVIWQLLQNSNFGHVEGRTVENHSSRDMLMRLLLEDTSAKSWIYHPRQDRKSKTTVKLVSIDQMRQEPVRPLLQPEPLRSKNQQERTRPPPDSSPLLARYQCQNCSETWIAGYDDENAKSCPICKQRNVSSKALPR